MYQGDKTKGKLKKSSELLLLCIPGAILVIIFKYLPMFGLVLAFKDYRYNKGFFGSEWSGFENFKFFFTSQDAWRITRNTVGMNLLFIIASTVVSLVAAILLNEIINKRMVKVYQTTMFFPYFLSWVVVAYILSTFINERYGMINSLLKSIGLESLSAYTTPGYWPFIFLIAFIWKGAGYGCIIYYAGIMGIDTEYYKAAAIDGASKFQMITKITIPMLMPIVTIMTLLSIGKIFYADFGMFYFLPQDIGMLYPTTDVIDTFVYRTLRVTGEVGLATAVGFYQAVVGLILVLLSNYSVRKYDKEYALY